MTSNGLSPDLKRQNAPQASPAKSGSLKSTRLDRANLQRDTSIRAASSRQVQQQQAVQATQSTSISRLAQNFTNRVGALFKGNTISPAAKQIASAVTGEELTSLENVGKTVEQQMAERGPSKRELAKQRLAEARANSLQLRSDLQQQSMGAPVGYLDALQEELEEDEEEEATAPTRRKDLAKLPLKMRMRRTEGAVLLKSSILLSILPKAIERWLELVRQGKPCGPTLRELKQLRDEVRLEGDQVP